MIWTPLFVVVFAGYWFWGSLMQPSVAPTVSCTWLSPVGRNTSAGLLGAKGADKTMLMRILAGVIRPTSGQAVVAGHDLAEPADRVAC